MGATSSSEKRRKHGEKLVDAHRRRINNAKIQDIQVQKEPTARMKMVSNAIWKAVETVLQKRRVSDPRLYPNSLPLEIVNVSVTPDLKRAYVRWIVPEVAWSLHVSNNKTFNHVASHDQKLPKRALRRTPSEIAQNKYLDKGPITESREVQRSRQRFENDTDHLPKHLQIIVENVNIAITKNESILRRFVGVELRGSIRYAPQIRWHRAVRIEKEL